jgi:hypothetical protein
MNNIEGALCTRCGTRSLLFVCPTCGYPYEDTRDPPLFDAEKAAAYMRGDPGATLSAAVPGIPDDFEQRLMAAPGYPDGRVLEPFELTALAVKARADGCRNSNVSEPQPILGLSDASPVQAQDKHSASTVLAPGKDGATFDGFTLDQWREGYGSGERQRQQDIAASFQQRVILANVKPRDAWALTLQPYQQPIAAEVERDATLDALTDAVIAAIAEAVGDGFDLEAARMGARAAIGRFRFVWSDPAGNAAHRPVRSAVTRFLSDPYPPPDTTPGADTTPATYPVPLPLSRSLTRVFDVTGEAAPGACTFRMRVIANTEQEACDTMRKYAEDRRGVSLDPRTMKATHLPKRRVIEADED